MARSFDWILHLLLGSVFLAAGSFLLLAGTLFGLLLLQGQGLVFAPFYGVTALALILHFLGWISLGLALRSLSGGTDADLASRGRAMTWALVASLAGFGIGIITLPLALPNSAITAFGLGLFPYIPSVFGPVVIAHAVFFFYSAKTLQDPRAGSLMVLGSKFLFVIATISVAAQVLLAHNMNQILVNPVGTTGVGYATVAAALLRERHAFEHTIRQ